MLSALGYIFCMGWIQFIIIVFGLISFALYVGSVFIPVKWSVRRSTLVSAKPEKIFSLVNDPQVWSEWTDWTRERSVVITEVRKPQGVKYKSEADSGIWKFEGIVLIKSKGASSEVFWEIKGNSGNNPIKRYCNLMMNHWIAPEFENGLKRLKEIAEKSQ